MCFDKIGDLSVKGSKINSYFGIQMVLSKLKSWKRT